MTTVDDHKSTTWSSPGQHATTGTDGNTYNGGSDGSSRTTAATSALSSNTDLTTKTSNEEGDGSTPHQTPMNQDARGSTTTYGENLKGIKLNLGLDFDLKDLSEEQKKDLESISIAYGLNVSELSQ